MHLSRIGIVFQILLVVIVAILVAFLIYHFTSSPRPATAPLIAAQALWRTR